MGIDKLLSGIIGLSMLGYVGIANAEEYKKEGFKTPDVGSAKYSKQIKADVMPTYPGKETLQKAYTAKDGTLFNTLEYKGTLYGFYVDTNGKMPMEYTLLDSNGDGIFTHKYGQWEEWPDPKWMK